MSVQMLTASTDSISVSERIVKIS